MTNLLHPNNLFKPSPFITRLAEGFDLKPPLDILDVGCWEGRHSIYLAKMGHNVIALSNELDELKRAQEICRSNYVGGSCLFVAGDARRLMFNNLFDVVLVNDVLHTMPKIEANQVLVSLDNLVKPGGLHAVSGYVVGPEYPAEYGEDYFVADELLTRYSSPGWEVLDYDREAYSYREHCDKQLVDSHASIVARKISQ